MKNFLLFSILLFSLSDLSAQFSFEKIYGNGNGICIGICNDNGFIIGGYDASNAFLFKIDQNGDSTWIKNHFPSEANDIEQTYDSGFIFVGSKVDTAIAVKTDQTGNTSWVTSIYDSIHHYSRQGMSIVQLEDSTFMLTSQEYRTAQNIPFVLSPVSVNGNKLHPEFQVAAINDIGNFSSSRIKRTSGHGFVMIGTIPSLTTGAMVTNIGKMDSLGATTWIKTYSDNSVNHHDIRAEAIATTLDGGYMVGGRSDNFTGSYDMFIMKLNSAGDSLWTKTYGSGFFNDIIATSDSGYVLLCDSNGLGNINIIRLNSVGNILWTRTFTGTGSSSGSHILQTNDGGFVIVGQTNGKVYVIKTNGQGSISPSVKITPSDSTFICPNTSVVITATAGFTYLWNTSATTSSINVTQPGDYFVTATAPGGLQANSDTVHISILSTNPVTITQPGGANTALISTPGLSYQWYLNSQQLSNTDSMSYLPLSDGNYSVSVIDSNGCMILSQPFTVSTFAGVGNTNVLPHSLIYKNNNESIDVNINSSDRSLRIFSSKGQILWDYDLTYSTSLILRVDLSFLSSGVYFIESSDKITSRKEKFIIQR